VGYHLPQDFAIYVSQDSALRAGNLNSLKSKTVGMPDEFGLIAMQALDTFQKQGLLPRGPVVRYEKYDGVTVSACGRRDCDGLGSDALPLRGTPPIKLGGEFDRRAN